MNVTFVCLILAIFSPNVLVGGTKETKSNNIKTTKSGESKETKTSKSTQKSGRHILFVAPFGSKSHKNFYNGIIDALADDGHKVTVITPYSAPKSHPNVEEIVFLEHDMSPLMANAFTDGLNAATMAASEKGPEKCFSALTSPRIDLVLEEKIDLAFVSIFFNECFLGVLFKKKIPFVLVNPAEMFGPFNAMRMGNPEFPSFNFNPMLNHESPLTLWERAVSTFALIVMELMVCSNYKRIDITNQELQLVDENSPRTVDIIKESSLMIVNSVRLEEHPRPYMPNIILAGTIQCRPAKKLPKDLEDWIQDSGDAGVVLFSIGSALRPSDVPESKEKILAKVFSELPQRVLWKYDKKKLNHVQTPSNVKLTEWVPQQDVLGHPKLKLFITHGGLNSMQEALYHGAPTIGLPIFGDQEGNVGAADANGWARKLSWDDITEETLMNAIKDVMTNKKMRAKLRKRASLIKDVPMTPTQQVTWWTNYILRTNGAKHLRSPAADLSWYELYNVDVWLIACTTSLLLAWLLLKLLVFCVKKCCCCFSRSNKQKNKKSKWD